MINKRKPERIAVTKNRAAAENAGAGESVFKDLAEKSLVGIYLIQDGIFQYANPRMGKIFGYFVREIIGKKGPKDLVSPEDWPMVETNINRRLAGRVKSINYEFRGTRKDGETVDIEAYGYGTVFCGRPALIGTLLDITRKKRSEHMLKEAEELYRGIFENAIEGIFQTTVGGKIISSNPALAAMLGYGSPEEYISSVTNMEQQHYVDPKQRQRFIDILERDGRALGFECEFFKKNGERIWVVINARAVRDQDGTTRYYEGSVIDITEQKKAEDDLRKLNEFNSAIIHNAPVAIFTLDRDGVFTSVNPALATLSGLGARAEEKLIGFSWLKNEYTVKCGLAGHIERGLKGEPFQLWDFPFMDYRGEKNIYIDFNGVPLRAKDGEIEGLLCIIEETTERVRTRAKLIQETQISAIGRLAAGAAHELNNPLATLVAFAEIASDLVLSQKGATENELDLDKLTYCLDVVQQQAFRCTNVIKDLLHISRRDGLEITDVDVNSLIENIFETIGLDKRGIVVQKELLHSLPLARADMSSLRQALMSLIQNAADAVEGRMDQAIHVRTYMKGSTVGIDIEDNGIGIPGPIIEKIFEPFFTTKEAKKGIGLGLSLCHDFLESMKGTIRVESKPGRGTVFFLTLPAKDSEGNI